MYICKCTAFLMEKKITKKCGFIFTHYQVNEDQRSNT